MASKSDPPPSGARRVEGPTREDLENEVARARACIRQGRAGVDAVVAAGEHIISEAEKVKPHVVSALNAIVGAWKLFTAPPSGNDDEGNTRR